MFPLDSTQGIPQGAAIVRTHQNGSHDILNNDYDNDAELTARMKDIYFQSGRYAQNVAFLKETKAEGAGLDHNFKEWSGLLDLLSQQGNCLKHLTLNADSTIEGFCKESGLAEVAVTTLSSLSFENIVITEEMMRRFDEAIIGASGSAGNNDKKLIRSMCLYDCNVEVELSKSAMLQNLEHLRISWCSWPMPRNGCQDLGNLLLGSSMIWDLDLYAVEQLGWLADCLLSDVCRLRKLGLEYCPLPSRLIQAVASAECKLEGLTISELSAESEAGLANGLSNPNCNLRFIRVERVQNIDQLLQGIKHAPRITHLSASWQRKDNIAAFGFLLRSPDCELRNFTLTGTNEDLLGWQEEIVGSLEANYSSRILTLDLGPWQSKLLEHRWSSVLHRNQLFVQGANPILHAKPMVKPSSAKLFICGHTRTGKTTICTNLTRSKWQSPLWRCIPQAHESTQGIQRKVLSFKNKTKLLMFDLGGQEVFHAFHHYFVRGSDKDMFIILIKVIPGQESSDELKRNLCYWLRFIVSHQSSTPGQKPKVLIVLNKFGQSDEGIALATANDILSAYITKLDIIESILQVHALDAREVQRTLIPKLEAGLNKILDEREAKRQLIPWTCHSIIQARTQPTAPWYSICGKTPNIPKKVVQVDELLESSVSVSRESRLSAAEYTLICLHDMGEAVFFGAQESYLNNRSVDSEVDLLANNAVLDMPWFLGDVIQKLIPQQDRTGVKVGDSKLSTGQVVAKLELESNMVAFLLKLLHEMGMLIPLGATKWSDPNQWPKEIIIPTLLSDDQGWRTAMPQEEGNNTWGRRLQAQEDMKDFVLLPSGVFAIIQAKVKQLCDGWGNESWKLGNGWISFQEDDIEVVIKVGGDYDAWIDRQWVDIVLTTSQESQRCAKAEQVLDDIFNTIVSESYKACPYIKLSMYVLCPKQARTSLSTSSTIRSAPLENIIDKASGEGLDYRWTWEQGSSSKVGELLMPNELKKLTETRKSILHDIVTGYEELLPVFHDIPKDSIQEIPEFDNEDMNKLAQFVWGCTQDIKNDIKVSTQKLLDAMERMEVKLRYVQDSVMKNCSTLLQQIKVPYPKLPHFSDESNILLRYVSVIGKKCWIHYLCEEGFHQVNMEKYRGVEVIVEHGWFHKHRDVLIPAFSFLVIVAKLSGVALPKGGDVLTNIVDLTQAKFQEIVKSSMGDDVIKQQGPPSDEHVEEIFEFVKMNAPPECQKNEDLLMRKCFGLHRRGDKWVCDKH